MKSSHHESTKRKRNHPYKRLWSGCIIVFPVVVVVVEGLSLHLGTVASTSIRCSIIRDSPSWLTSNSNVPLHLASSSSSSSSSATSSLFGPNNNRTTNIMFSSASLEEENNKAVLQQQQQQQTDNYHLVVPTWLPYLFTRAQLECLRVLELRAACSERGLKKSGTKPVLQNRLMEWVVEQHQCEEGRKQLHKKTTPTDPSLEYHRKVKQQRKQTNDDTRSDDDIIDTSSDADDEDDYYNDDSDKSSTTLQPTGMYLKALKHNFYTKTAKFSNLEAREMYQNAKHADQNGDKVLARQVLYRLHEASPGDGRVLRRLARLAVEVDQEDEARRLLQLGTRLTPNNGYLWHGLAQLEVQQGNWKEAREFFKKATEIDSTLPNSYHAWARLEQSQGNIRVAAALLRKGLRSCPTNHRLWHALGGLYRDAGMYAEATHAFEKGLQCSTTIETPSSSGGTNWSQSFFCTESAYVAYEMGDVELARRHMQNGLKLNPRHAQGWLSLAQLEESCFEKKNNVIRARAVYQNAVDTHERSRNIYHVNDRRKDSRTATRSPLQPGDKWLALYLNWAKMEESRDNQKLANMVYSRAAHVFPTEWEVFLNWAMHQAKRKFVDKAKATFKKACMKAGRGNSEPYRIYGEYAMELKDYDVARMIFFSGAKMVTTNCRVGRGKGLAALLHSWAKCELLLNNLDRAFELLERALCLTGDDSTTTTTTRLKEEKSHILSTMATVECARENYRLAKHCVSLAIWECGSTNSPHHASSLWKQWATISERMNDDALAQYCHEQAHVVLQDKTEIVTSSLPVLAANHIVKESSGKAPWYKKILRERLRK